MAMHVRATIRFCGLTIAALLLSVSATTARAGEWTTDYAKALEEAKKSNKLVLADFTGSDWCIWCKKLKAEVFDTEEFKAWADKNAVLLELDFPRATEQSAELKKQNQALKEKFEIAGFPTVIFLDGDGKEVGRNGYFAGGPADWIKDAELTLFDKRPAIQPLTSLAKGFEQAKAESKTLLLIGDPKDDKAVPALIADPALAKCASVRLVVVYLKGKLEGENARGMEEFIKKYGFKSDHVVAAIDPSKDKPLINGSDVPEPGKLLADLRKALPPMTYDGGWLDDYPKAAELALQLKRPILLDFTVAENEKCVQLDKEVLSTDAFKNYAKDNLVLVKFDFSRKPTTQPSATCRHYAHPLAKEFSINDVPSLVVQPSAGKKIGQMGYVEGGPDAFLPKLKELVKDAAEAPKEPAKGDAKP